MILHDFFYMLYFEGGGIFRKKVYWENPCIQPLFKIIPLFTFFIYNYKNI